MKKFSLFFILFSTLFAFPTLGHTGQISLSTYYPAPLGSYDQLRLVPRNGISDPCQPGTLYVNSDMNNMLQFCADPNKTGTGLWSPLAGVWTQDTNNNVYLTDQATLPFVGIGTTMPEFKLSLDNDGGIIAKGTFGSGATLTTTGAGTRLIWYPKKAAFRVGYVDGRQWNNDIIGDFSSVLGGVSNIASGAKSTVAGGQDNSASGYKSFVAAGLGNVASGSYSVSIGGEYTLASGQYSTTLGTKTTAQAYGSTVLGRNNIISGNTGVWIDTDPLFVIGNGGTALGSQSNALTVLKNGNVGIGTTTPAEKLDIVGQNDADIDMTSFGSEVSILHIKRARGGLANEAIIQDGDSLAGVEAMGYDGNGNYIRASSISFDVDGTPQASAVPGEIYFYTRAVGDTTSWSGTKRMIIRSDGNVGIGTDTPEFKLSLDNDGGIIAKGTFGLATATTLPDLNAGTRMVWYPKKAAFRVGYLSTVGTTYWNDSNIGNVSVAMGQDTVAQGQISTAMGYLTDASGSISTATGYSTKASGDYSTAIGDNTTASGKISTAMGNQTIANGDYSTAMGVSTEASGDYSTAMGANTEASGDYSTAMGVSTTASGNYSTTMGFRTTARTYFSVVLGRWNIPSGSTAIWVPSDPLFIIGNGTNGSSRSNAFEVLKNGTVKVEGATVHSSDRRLKKNILPITGALEKLNQINGVNYEWISKNRPAGLKLGVIAQDVEKVYPELVSEDPTTGMKSVNYNGLIAPLIEAVKELKAENESLKKRIENLENK